VTFQPVDGGNDIVVSLTGSLAASPYQYSINGFEFQASTFRLPIFGNLVMIVTDKFGCSVAHPFLAPEPLRGYFSVAMPSCAGSITGYAEVVALGGTPPFLYGVAPNYSPSSRIMLPPGAHVITIRDSTNPPQLFELPVTIETLPAAFMWATVKHAPYPGGVTSFGEVTVTATGDSFSGYKYDYTPRDGFAEWVTNQVFNVRTGARIFKSLDERTCIVNVPVTISTVLSVSATHGTACRGGSVTVSLNITGGTAPYWTRIEPNTEWVQGSGPFSLNAGSHNIYVRDSSYSYWDSLGTKERNQIVSVVVDIPEYEQLVFSQLFINASTVDPPVSGDGIITSVAERGPYSGSFTYRLTRGSVDVTQVDNGHYQGLLPGNYDLLVTDSDGCFARAAVEVPLRSFEVDTVTVSGCSREALGAVSFYVSPTFAAPVIITHVGDGTVNTTDAMIAGLSVGYHEFILTDSSSPPKVRRISATVPEPPELFVSLQTTAATSRSISNGRFELAATGGSGPLEFYAQIAAGFYRSASPITMAISQEDVFWQVKDTKGCIKEGTFFSATPLSVELVGSIRPTCDGATSGSFKLYASGGTLPIYFTIEGPANSSMPSSDNGGVSTDGFIAFSHVGEGTWFVKAVDSSPFSIPKEATINIVIASVKLSVYVPPVAPIPIYSPAVVSVVPIGGVPPFQYCRAGSFCGPNAFVSFAGLHGFTVTDSVGCSAYGEVEILYQRSFLVVRFLLHLDVDDSLMRYLSEPFGL
jgi:hypothetical protein